MLGLTCSAELTLDIWRSYVASLDFLSTGSPAEFCQLKVGDEILSLGGTGISHLEQGEWEAAINQSLENGRLVMDVRRHGKKGACY